MQTLSQSWTLLVDDKGILATEKQWKGITYVKDILDNNCEFVDYITLNEKYDIGDSFLNIYN